MSVYYAYVSAKVDDDDVAAAIAAAKTKAITKLGSSNIVLHEYTWTSKEVCTCWRLWVPDIPPPPPS